MKLNYVFGSELPALLMIAPPSMAESAAYWDYFPDTVLLYMLKFFG